MNKRRTKKAVKKWYEGRLITGIETEAVLRWHRCQFRQLGFTADQATEGLKRMARALDAVLLSSGDVRKRDVL